MKTAITSLQILFSVLLIGAILLQAKGTGLGSLWGGTGGSYRSKRGIEKTLFTATIILVIFFLLIAIVNLLI